MRKRIGLIIGETANEYCMTLIDSIYKEVLELDYDIFVFVNYGIYDHNIVLYGEGESSVYKIPVPDSFDGFIIDETLFNIRDMNAYHRGMVTLACIPTAVFYFLPLAIGKFNELYPNIKVRILEQGTNNCMESVLCNESDFGINMNNVTNSSIDFTPLVNEPFVLACRRDHPLAKKQLVEWQELVGYKMIGVRSSSGNRLLIEQQLADKPWKLDWFYEVRHLSTSLGLVEAGLGISALPGLAMPHAPYSSIIGIPLVEPVIRRTLGIIRRKDAVLSPAAERFFALLINLWTDDKDNLWTNIVERQRHALQEIS